MIFSHFDDFTTLNMVACLWMGSSRLECRQQVDLRVDIALCMLSNRTLPVTPKLSIWVSLLINWLEYQNARLVQFKLVLFNCTTHHCEWILCICRHFFYFSKFCFSFLFSQNVEMWKRSSPHTHTLTPIDIFLLVFFYIVCQGAEK